MHSLKFKLVTKFSNYKSNPLLSRILDSLLNHNQTRTIFVYSSSIQRHGYSTATQYGNDISSNQVVTSFKEWFDTTKNPQFDQIFTILSQNDLDDTHFSLSQLGLRLNERTVLDVLNYGCRVKGDVLSCLKFFDWAGRHHGFHHTRVTFSAIFKILSKAKLMSLMLDFLRNFAKYRYNQRVRFHDTLVMGYAVAGKPELALELFGRMRFQGLDLNEYAYHILLNALVEEACYHAADVVAKHISLRGFENDVTRAILTKSLCRQNLLVQAEEYLLKSVANGLEVNGHAVGFLIDALCKSNKFERASELVEEFKQSNVESMNLAYGVWIRGLVQLGNLDRALQFLKSKKLEEGYVPEVFRYNVLVCRLLKENRLEEVFDLLMEMKEVHQISPDTVTMNASLCFFCKAGMVNVALQLYDLKSELGLSINAVAYNYLINTLCGDGSTDEAYRVLKNSIEQGLFPGRKTISIIANILCSEGKLDKMKELLIVAEQNCTPNDLIYDKFIYALCQANKVEDAYLIYRELNKDNRAVSKSIYFSLIDGFNKLKKGDIAARLFIEMQNKGHCPTRDLYRAVICCTCQMKNPEKQFLTLFEMQMQLSRNSSNMNFFKFFIDGAGHAIKPEFAREVYERMLRSGLEPTVDSGVLMLQSYLKSGKISDALQFFKLLESKGRIGRKLYNTMVVGLCKANRITHALNFLKKMRDEEVTPSYECYEFLIQFLCSNGEYETAIKLIEDSETVRVRVPVTSFIGNVLLMHSLKSKDLYKAWKKFREVGKESSKISQLGQLVGLFSNCNRADHFPDIEDLEEVIQQCFSLDIYTYNMLLKKLINMKDIDYACMLFTRICERGYEPNRWTYEILVIGLLKHKRTYEANRFLYEMIQKGLDPSECGKLFREHIF